MYFRHISAKIQPKNLKTFISSWQCEVTFRLGGLAPNPTPHGYALALQ